MSLDNVREGQWYSTVPLPCLPFFQPFYRMCIHFSLDFFYRYIFHVGQKPLVPSRLKTLISRRAIL